MDGRPTTDDTRRPPNTPSHTLQHTVGEGHVEVQADRGLPRAVELDARVEPADGRGGVGEEDGLLRVGQVHGAGGGVDLVGLVWCD